MINNKKYVLFGAGVNGRNTADFLTSQKVAFIVDNDSSKNGTFYNGLPIYSYDYVKEKLLDYSIVISVSDKYRDEIAKQLTNDGFTDFKFCREVMFEITKERINNRIDYIGIYNKAIKWIEKNTVEGKGIICSTNLPIPYPEVSGYYIPTLIRWGYRDLAVQYAKWLCSIQKEDGSWYDTNDNSPYVFDSAQILKGLIAIRDILPEVDKHIIMGCDWILSNMQENGRLITPDMTAWGNDGSCSELVHIYCLSPIKEAGIIFDRPDYIESADRIFSYYKTNHYDDIMNFRLLSHFYAYLMEALVDIGEIEMAKEAMSKIENLQNKNGMVPAYQNVHWVCSTGLFQLALVWFRLGNTKCGTKTFEYACSLQNESGGWYGSYIVYPDLNENNNYFPACEISWAVKYFLDALYYKNITEFNEHSAIFLDEIKKDDGRYICIRNEVHSEKTKKILDIGCGKGRYIKNLIEDEPQNEYYAVDISEKVMESISGINKAFGTLTCIPYPDNYFDVVYTCEALEHAVDIRSAIIEMVRVTKLEGKIVVIDKNKDMLGALKISAWEQWFDINEMSSIIEECFACTRIIKNISYENMSEDIFCAWIGEGKVIHE